MGENRRRDLFRHLIDDNADDYLAIVTCLSGTLVSDLSAADIAARIPGSPLSADIVEQRCRRLVEWGNLTATRPVGVNTDTDRDRFRVTVFGGRVHREATAVLTAHDGARDVAREVLGLIASDLDRLTDALRTARVDPDAVAGLVTSVFTHHRTFTDSIADFYAHLADVLARLELSRDDVGRLKTLLLEYVDLLDGDVTSHTPVIAVRLDALIPRLDPLLAAPARTTDPRGLSHRDAITGVQQALYSPSLWGSLRGGLKSLADGNGDTLLLLADMYEGRSDDGTYSNINDAFNAIRCVDDTRITDRAVAGEADTRFRQVAPFLDDGRGTGQAALDLCAFWPVPNTGEPHTPDVPGLAPVLVVSTTEDPATPYQAGVDLARQLGGALISFDGTQHTVVLDGEQCVDDPVIRYLVTLEVPESDPHC